MSKKTYKVETALKQPETYYAFLSGNLDEYTDSDARKLITYVRRDYDNLENFFVLLIEEIKKDKTLNEYFEKMYSDISLAEMFKSLPFNTSLLWRILDCGEYYNAWEGYKNIQNKFIKKIFTVLLAMNKDLVYYQYYNDRRCRGCHVICNKKYKRQIFVEYTER
jgi:hypothetical protein